MEKCFHTCRRASGRRPASSRFVALIAIVSLFAWGTAAAVDGDLDPTFGSGGFTLTGVTTASFQLPTRPVVQADGKILLCSALNSGGSSGQDFFIARFNANGTLDTSFNFDGKVTVDFDGGNDFCNAIALQSDGKIVVAGSTDNLVGNTDFAIARLNADGTLDPDFGAGTGKRTVTFDLGGTNADFGTALAIQPDGKLVVAGWADTGANTDDFAIVRLLPDGTRDTAFNATGRVTVGFDFVTSTYKRDQAGSVAIDSAGRIVVGGIAEKGPGGISFDFAVARLLPNGQFDPNFDADGRATIGFDLGPSQSDLAYSMILQRDGKIVLAGYADTGSGTRSDDMGLARLLADGSPDTGFGIGGKTTVAIDLTADGSDSATGIVEDSAGRLVIAGNASASAAVARLHGNGDLDLSFGSFGKKTFDFGTAVGRFTGIALQGTQIIATGVVTTATDSDNVVARLQVDLIFANGFE